MKLAKARSLKSFFGVLSKVLTLGGPVAVVGFRFDLYKKMDAVSMTFVGAIVLIPIFIQLYLWLKSDTEEMPVGVPRTFIYTAYENRYKLLLLFMFIAFNTETFSELIYTWYEIMTLILLFGIAGSLCKRTEEYWKKEIEDIKLYRKFKKWDKEE